MKTHKKLYLFILGLLFMGLQSCTHDDRDTFVPIPADENQIAYDAADMINGSRLYNDFTKSETGFVTPNDPSVVLENITEYKDFYRCKQCHAWDQKARFASYINRAPNTTRPDVSSVQLTNLKYADISILFERIKNTGGAAVDPARTADGTNPALGGNNHPDYGTILSDALIWDLVKFLKEGALDTDELYAINTEGTYPTGSRTFTDLGRNGNATSGHAFFAAKCASCHGADGTTIDIGGKTLGNFTRSNPHEVQHKVVSGQLGSPMGSTPTTLEEMKNLYKALSDQTAYPD
ncbi:MAG: cytochrome c [Flavobacteriaceae bacterium]|nr:cytochrome c [Flavobacteriaceae bacterium]